MDDIPLIGPILEYIQSMLSIETWINRAVDIFLSLTFLEQFVGLIILGVVLILGVFSLIKKLSKIIIVVAILVGLYLFYKYQIMG